MERKHFYQTGAVRLCLAAVFLLWSGILALRASDRYVATNGTDTGDFLTWATASSNIQWAVDKALAAGDTVWVSNGTYVLTNQIVVTNNIVLRSANGPDGTILNGNRSVRCLYVSNDSALISGLLITNGLNTNDGYGGGAFLRKGVVSNCWITGSLVSNPVTTTYIGGGGIYVYKPSTVKSSRVYGNWFYDTANNNDNGGGGIYIYQEACVTDTVVMLNTYSNKSGGGDGGGGGVKMTSGGTKPLVNCQIISNAAYGSSGSALNGGGGIHISWGGTVKDSVISGNTNMGAGGGGVTMRYGGELRNCLICSNGSAGGTLAVAATGPQIIQNCTIVENRGVGAAVRLEEGPSASYIPLSMVNTIVYSNFSSGNVSNWWIVSNTTNICLTNNCTYPTNFPANNIISGNISNNPLFIDCPAGNYRLAGNSPCINAGTNQSWMTTAFDLSGRQRLIQTTVDMGAYESEYYFSLSSAVTNTVMKGSATNFPVYLVNSNEAELYWEADNTSTWVILSASSGTIPSNATYNETFTNVFTNSSLWLNPGTYYSRVTVRPNYTYRSTGTVDMTLHVAEFGRSATSLTAMVKQFGTFSTNISIWNQGAGELPYVVSTNVVWLNVTPVSGVLTGQTDGATNTFTVLITNTALAVGTHYGAVTFSPNGIEGTPLDIGVTLTVTTGPQIVVSPLILTGAVMMGQNLAAQTVRVSNAGSIEQIGYQAATNQSWVMVSPTNGTLEPQASTNLVVSYQSSGLTTNTPGPSNYNATIRVTATNADAIGSPADVAVSLVVNPKASLAVGTTLLTNIVTEGYDAPDSTFEVWNGNGYYILSYAVSDNADWFVLTPSSGTSTGEHDVITVEYSTAGFRAGVSNAVITVVGRAYDGVHYDSALEATQTISVALMVIPVAELATDAAAVYQFSTRFGHAAGSASFHVWNAADAGSVLQWTLATNAGWLSASPVLGTSGGEENEITFTCNSGGLRPGRYSGVLTINGTDQATGNEAVNSPANINVELTILGDKGFDFGGDGDGASDLVVYQDTSGLWNITNLFSGYTTNVVFGGLGYVPAPGDYEGDGVSDLALYRYASGYWYERKINSENLTSAGGSFWAGPSLASLGGYVPVAGDYDGDGKTDPTMYNELRGVWSAQLSGSGYAYVSAAFGGSGYTAIPADYDGDGITDPAVYNETTAQWYLLYSSDPGRVINGTFGGPGFTAAPADYDGDGKADACIYKEATGYWVILPSSTLGPSGYVPVTGIFGGPGFTPVPADYTGDGKADACVYEEALGNWYIISITGTVVAWPAKHGGYGFAPVKP